jgi:lysophospholipase L1-like esterase
MKKDVIAILFGAALVLSPIAPARGEDAFAKKILELQPDADTNGDGVLSSAEEAAHTQTILNKFPRLDRDGDGVLSEAEKQTLLRIVTAREKRKSSPGKPAVVIPTTDKWKTVGLQQANTMGAGEAAIPESGKFRVFVLMGQSNMHGTGRTNELKAPYTEKHDRIRVWANGRWEYFVPSQRFGPGVSFAHQLAAFWPQDTIGIIKVSSGGTGIRGFEKNWSAERASLAFDEKKGSLYRDLMNAVAEAKQISKPEFCGFFWKQGAADGTKKVLANEYYDTFKQLVSDLRTDLETPELPVFVPSYMNDEDLLKAIMSNLGEEDLEKVKHPAGKVLEKKGELLESALAFLNGANFSKLKKIGGKRAYMVAVIAAQNRAGRDIPNVTTIYPGQLPKGADGIHFSAEGYITLGKFTASAVEEVFKGQEERIKNE